MHITAQHFRVGDVPGVRWCAGGDDAPLVLLGHGGGQHKLAPSVVARAQRVVTNLGFTAIAIDAPGHGDRPRDPEDERFVAAIRARTEPLGPLVADYNAALATRAVPEWQAVLDAHPGHGPVGYWGVSLGSALGIPLAAAEPRITAAVLGLVGTEALAAAAAKVTIPVRFLLQWDDELVPRAAGLAVYDAFSSTEKTLHANPGRHAELPPWEHDSAERFLARHLRHP
ncbi:dienelactone hydrolase family protein [Asanoa iriomotensis]|uniref:AB hydrolase-1 domain-containing protein n=1 Tax=Asanoa iriomotensis TaxID=234613 RepID=A0ABQ4CB69_9ACTN|nr:alpha/beta fold hydrolase [Asanoa iriomotensis]GIF60014.1 hypothetical protein Air01nite_61090 [Asanoa iriomotensis]